MVGEHRVSAHPEGDWLEQVGQDCRDLFEKVPSPGEADQGNCKGKLLQR